MSTYLSQIEATTALIIRIQMADDDGMSPIYALGTTIVEIDSPTEILAKQHRHRDALLTLANVARALVAKIESEETRWLQSDEKFNSGVDGYNNARAHRFPPRNVG